MDSIFDPLKYSYLFRVQESPEVITEDLVQRIWFEQLIRTPLKTTNGAKVELLQAGKWNHGPGPDFLQAALRINGKLQIGDLEIHLRPEGWNQHGHSLDPHYNQVIAHLVWKKRGNDVTAETAGGKVLPEIELSQQLSVPESEVARFFRTSRSEQEVGERIGACQKELAALPEERRMELIEEAGRFRFYQRTRLASAKINQWGLDQALWLSLADALGFSRNRDPFRCLAQRYPIQSVRKLRKEAKREALLYGNAGFLPASILPEDDLEGTMRKVWKEWWKLRNEEQLPPIQSWDRRGIRPANRPERRLAVMSLLSESQKWKRMLELIECSGEGAAAFLGELEHPYWSFHATVGGKALQHKTALMGNSRVDAFLYNGIWPLAAATGVAGVSEKLEQAKTGESMLPARVAAVRLLGERPPSKFTRKLLLQEGLIQIYQDFCMREYDACRNCEFPELVKKYGQR
ncbi:MAG: DUF2851 family protein [Verrucomicrobiota bacterium]